MLHVCISVQFKIYLRQLLVEGVKLSPNVTLTKEKLPVEWTFSIYSKKDGG